MNRRSFFKLAGLGAGAAVVATVAPSLLAPKTTTYSTYILGENAIVNGSPEGVLTLSDVRRCVEQLKKVEVKPINGQFTGWVHPDREDEVAEWISYK